jgi:hypothetical protein
MVYRYFLIFFVVILTACADRSAKVYDVPAEVHPIVETFIFEAGIRGKRLKVDDLVITYENNLFSDYNKAAGICRRRYGHTPVIHIDTNSANWKTSEMSREQLIFHELCHCLLGRGHKDDLLQNGNFASIMKSTGEVLYGPMLTSHKRAYYLDELFNPNAEHPAWAQNTETAQTFFPATDTLFLERFGEETSTDSLSFSDTIPQDTLFFKDWLLGEGLSTRRTIRDGLLQLESFEKGTYFISYNTDLTDWDNFQISIQLALVKGKHTRMAVYWGGSQANDLFSFTLTEDGYATVGNTAIGAVFAKSKLKVENGAFNQLIIRKKDCCYYIFLNDTLVDNMRFESLNGSLMGIGISGDPGEVWVNEILITAFQSDN